VICLAAAVVAVSLSGPQCFAADPTGPVGMLHVTDLFRPHNDPDDHWDLACVYSLAWQQKVDLVGILIDYPQQGRKNDPDVMSVAQLNYLTGQTVPVVVGSPRWISAETADRPENALALRGVRSMLRMLREAPEPIVINVLGSCRDVAIAGSLEPNLFAEKCRAIYLNAGSGTPDPKKAVRLEWNVQLDPHAYAAVFSLPCPIYWMPCFEEVGAQSSASSRLPEYGTYFRFRQQEILPHLSQHMQNYFAFMFRHGHLERKHTTAEDIHPDWLDALVGPVNPELLARMNQMDRNMWCTGGFLHAAGYTVTTSGEIVPAMETEEHVFTFEAIDVSAADTGVTTWRSAVTEPPRYIFHVRDPQRYPAAMTRALKSLVQQLNSTGQ
jgi:hypothetical protein